MPPKRQGAQDDHEFQLEKKYGKMSLEALKLEKKVVDKAIDTREAEEGGYQALHDLNKAGYERGCSTMMRMKVSVIYRYPPTLSFQFSIINYLAY